MPRKDTKLKKISETIHMAVEDIRLSGAEDRDLLFMRFYTQQADTLSDSRQTGKKQGIRPKGTGTTQRNGAA